MRTTQTKINISNKEILDMYYKSNTKYINTKQIQIILGCQHDKAAKIRDDIKRYLLSNDIDTPIYYIPLNELLRHVGTSIDEIESNYIKEVKLSL